MSHAHEYAQKNTAENREKKKKPAHTRPANGRRCRLGPNDERQNGRPDGGMGYTYSWSFSNTQKPPRKTSARPPRGFPTPFRPNECTHCGVIVSNDSPPKQARIEKTRVSSTKQRARLQMIYAHRGAPSPLENQNKQHRERGGDGAQIIDIHNLLEATNTHSKTKTRTWSRKAERANIA